VDAVITDNLTKHYGPRPALRGLNLRVPSGRLFGFLGPNGAGKTTAIRVLLGLLRATAGRAQVLGRDVWRDGPALRARVGYLPGDVRFYDWMTGRATLAFVDAARRSNAWAEARRLTKRLDLDLSRRIRDYSRGMKQKLGLIIALMHRPELIILDEPTISLDPLMREVLYAELRAVAGEGRTVLLSSHTLAEVEALCDEVAILRDGKLVEQERIDVLRQRAVRHVQVRFHDRAAPALPLPAGLEVSQQGDGYLEATWRGPVERLVSWLARCPVQDVTIAPPDLEDLFLGYYAGNRGELG
jgi:ABC-2 type transport system ATP-binding protein